MDDMTWVYLLLVALVVAFGVGVVLVGRRRTRSGAESAEALPAAPPTPAVVPQHDEHVGSRESDDEAVVEAVDDAVADAEVAPPRSMRDRLSKARSTLSGALGSVLGRSAIDADTWDELEEGLLLADVGIGVTTALLDPIRDRVTAKEIETPNELVAALRAEMIERLAGADRTLARRIDEGPSVWLFVGVNGVGKTTTIGKLAAREAGAGTSVLLAAGDTFRAAAAEQLETWAQRSGAEFVRGAEGGDPASVIFDGVERAASRGIQLVLADTAGRLHNKQNLMDELAKVRRVAEKGAGVVTETLLVIDATTGQNGLAQAREFREATAVTGVVVTKLDGSAKGGIVFAIETELGIPVKYVGIGETIDDLVPFDATEFVDALVGR
ncbi:MAG: signal recognition particle-docking protein FtsY [Ilumatobacteraceae bacterium]